MSHVSYQLSQTQSLGLPRSIQLQLPILVEVGICGLESCLTESRTFQHGAPETGDHAKCGVESSAQLK